MKNTEWGAAVYLSKSSYGINDEIWINPAINFTTGCAGNTVNSGYTIGCINAYNTNNGVKASTTGNITGIYDMSGGSFENVMGNLDNIEGFMSDLDPATVPDKYIDRYSSTINNSYNNTYFGDAYFETSFDAYVTYIGNEYGAWYGDGSSTPEVDGVPWFVRGGIFSYSDSGGAFYFSRNQGVPWYGTTFRPVLIVGAGL
jgi:hypothetical protein